MNKKRHEPQAITQSFYQIGTHSFPVYLSVGEKAMIIEGGTGATFRIIKEQIEQIGIEPERIDYVALTHTHSDHIGAIPHLKKLWPHLKIIASPIAAKLLRNEHSVKEFLVTDRSIADIMISNGEINYLPPELDKYEFDVAHTVEEGDTIDLGSGISWTVHNTPGHSACHISLYEHKEKTLVIGDATGFYVPEKDVYWPNYFESFKKYCNSIHKLSNLPAIRAALSHNGVITTNLELYFKNALNAAESYHLEMLDRIKRGEDSAKIALEKAKWVNSLTDIQTFDVMRRLAKLLITRSQAVANKEHLTTVSNQEK